MDAKDDKKTDEKKTEAKQNPFFKFEDFQKMKITIEGTNVTSQMRISGGPTAIQLIEIFEDGICIDLPPKACSMGHTLSLTINARKVTGTSQVRLASGETVEQEDFSENKLQIMGVIETLEEQPNGGFQARLKFRQYAMAEWEALLNYFSGKQSSINELIKNTRK